jgi:hypothetical protein
MAASSAATPVDMSAPGRPKGEYRNAQHEGTPVGAPRGGAAFCAVANVTPGRYRRSALHADERLWVEKNCYVDIWIGVLHALGLNPLACLPFTLAVDFEGDQWTFFKPSHDDLYELYGVDVQELTVWRSLLEHAQEHLAAGRLISTESDAFWLPDTAGTDYRQKHTKTTIVLNDIDVAAGRLGYFHNAGYHQLEGEDFERTFRVGAQPDPSFMPLYAELVKLDRKIERTTAELRTMSRVLLAKYLRRIPQDNPFVRFRERFERDLPWLQQQGLEHYHAWAFAATRQAGAAFELAAQHARWLAGEDGPDAAVLTDAAAALEQVSSLCKAFILKGARLVMSKKAFTDAAMFDDMALAWSRAMALLSAGSATR